MRKALDLFCQKKKHTPQIHVTGPIWRKALDNEIETKGELVSIKDGTATMMSAECGLLTFGTHKCLAGYVPQEGDRVRACVVKPPPAPPGDKKGGSAR